MSEIRNIICSCGGEILGTVSFDEPRTEEEWKMALSGYLCDKCPRPLTRNWEDEIDLLKKEMSQLKIRFI